MPSPKRLIPSVLLAAVAAFGAGPSGAEVRIFFGNDPFAAGVVPPGGSAQTARNAFIASLLTDARESFDGASFIAGTQPTVVSPQAVLGGAGAMYRNPGALGTTLIENRTFIGGVSTGRFNTSSPGAGNWWETSASFTLTLTSGVQAIGFYGTDFGDFGGSLRLALFNGDQPLVDNILVGPGGGQNGSLLFYGYLNTEISFNRVVFTLTQLDPDDIDSYDLVGLDDLVVGTAVPEPQTWILFTCGLGLVLPSIKRRSIARLRAVDAV